MKILDLFFYSEILLLINLCVALGNAYITPLPLSPEEAKAAADAAPVPQPTAAPTKKGNKAEQQAAAAAAAAAASTSVAVKNDDLKASLDVSLRMKSKTHWLFYSD